MNEKVREILHREVHLTWQHLCYIGGAFLLMMGSLTTMAAANRTDINTHQRVLEQRAPAVAELARVAQQVNSEALASRDFREEVGNDLDAIRRAQERMDDKLDRLLELELSRQGGQPRGR